MGLKSVDGCGFFCCNHLLLKSDQNGIEIGSQGRCPHRILRLKSDQNGIEITYFTSPVTVNLG